MSKGRDHFLDNKILRMDLNTGEVSTTNFKSFIGILRFHKRTPVKILRKTEDSLIIRLSLLKKEEETLLYFKRKMRKIDGHNESDAVVRADSR